MPHRFSARSSLAVAMAIAVACLGGCQQKSSQAGTSSQGIAAEAPPQLAVPVAIEYARTDSIASYYSATATLEVEREAVVPARVTGVVEAIAVEEGDYVQASSKLMSLDNDQYRLRVEQTSAAVQNLASQVERLERIQEDLVSAEEVETARKDLATARAEEGLATLNLSYTAVTAPFAGRVVRRYVDVGQTVAVDAPLFAVADFNPLLARIHVPAKEFRNIESSQEVALVLDSSGKRLTGRITLVSPVIDPSTGTIKVTVEVSDYPEETRPGDFAEVLIVTEERDDTVIVSQGAVFTDKGEQVIYVAADRRAERRVVEIGFSDDEHVELLSGVEAGEAVVVKGQRSLKHGTPLKILEGETRQTEESNLGNASKSAPANKKSPVKST